MKIVAMLVLSLAFVGCATLPTEQRAEEATYQALLVSDTIQSINGAVAHPDVYRETNRILPSHPNAVQTIAVMGAQAALHGLVTQQLYNRNAPIWAQRIWQAVTIGMEADTVRGNWQIGLRLSPSESTLAAHRH